MKFWKDTILKYYIYLPEKCPKCELNKYSIGNLINIINPIRFVCNNYKFNYRCSLHKFFLSKFPKYPASIIMTIISKLILEEQNALEIHKYLTYNLKSKVSYVSITKVLIWIRRALAHYIKDIYRLYKLGKPNGESLISVDESLFIHLKRQKIWVLGS